MEVPRLSSWRSCLEPSLEDVELGKEPEGLLSSLSSDGLGEGKGSDPFSWRIPTLNYERRTKVDFDDFVPAIRKSRSASSLGRARRDRRDHRPLTVRFEDEAIASGSLEPSNTKGTAKGREEPGDVSDASSSSGSHRSSRSADSIKRRPQPPRAAGEGSSGRAGSQGSAMSRRAEAEGREDDVSSIMKKYLGKE